MTFQLAINVPIMKWLFLSTFLVSYQVIIDQGLKRSMVVEECNGQPNLESIVKGRTCRYRCVKGSILICASLARTLTSSGTDIMNLCAGILTISSLAYHPIKLFFDIKLVFSRRSWDEELKMRIDYVPVNIHSPSSLSNNSRPLQNKA